MKKTEQYDAPLPTLPKDPPLRAVRAFEAVARLGGIGAAAKELAISPSAVSHQLKTLEAFLEMPLTERQGRTLILRDEGREYYRSIRAAFNVLRQATEQVRERSASRQVTISLIPLFGMVGYSAFARSLAKIRISTSTWCTPITEITSATPPICRSVLASASGPATAASF